MKKFFAGMMAAMLFVAVMGTTVFASDSPKADDALAKKYNENVTAVTVSGASGNIKVNQQAVTDEQVKQGEAAVKEKNYGSASSVLAMTDLEVPKGTDTSNGVTVSLTVPGVLPGDNIHVLHQTASGSWEELSVASVGTDSVKITMTSFSPIVVVRLAAKTTTNSNSGSNSSSTYYSSTYNGTTNSSTPNSGTTVNDTSTSSTTPSDTNAATITPSAGTQADSTGLSNTPASSQSDPADVNQNVTVNTPDSGTYGQGYNDGYTAGTAAFKGATAGTTVVRTVSTGNTSTGGSNLSATSPKTGASLPALPILAVFAFAGILVCGKKAQNR